MATYNLISSQTLATSAASVTFSSIPQTYTDLVLKVSARDTNAGSIAGQIFLNFNSDSGNNYSRTFLRGSGAAATSGRNSNLTYFGALDTENVGLSTANTFSNTEIYIPNYTTTTTKPQLSFGAVENNAATAYINLLAALYFGSGAITSIVIAPGSDNFATYSSFYLYGIKNS